MLSVNSISQTKKKTNKQTVTTEYNPKHYLAKWYECSLNGQTQNLNALLFIVCVSVSGKSMVLFESGYVAFPFSLSYILDGMRHGNSFNDNDNSKLFRIKLELWENRLKFVPSLSEEINDKDSFINTIKSLIKDICSVSHQIDRIAQPISECTATKRTYQSE